MRCDRPKVPSLNVAALRRRPHGKFAVCLTTLTENCDGDSDWARRCCLLILTLRHALANKHTLSRQSFVQFFDFFLFLLFFFWALHTPSRLSYCPTHRCWPSVCLFFLSLFTLALSLATLLAPLCHSPFSTLSLYLCLVGVLFIHVFSTYLRHSYSHCSTTVYVSFYPCACALCPCLCVDSPCCCCCWCPWLKSRSPVFGYHITPCSFSLSHVLSTRSHVCVCVKDWKSELYFCFSWLLRCTLHTFSLEDYTLHTLRSPHFPSLFLYKG